MDRLWDEFSLPIVGVTGKKSAGKSLWLASIDPERTLYVDAEDSVESYADLPIKRRVSLYEEFAAKVARGKTPKAIEIYEWFRDLVASVEPGEFSVLAIDPANDLEQGMWDWVEQHPEEFGHSKAQYDRMSALMHGDAKVLYKMTLGLEAQKFQTIAFATHVGQVWRDNKPTSQLKAKGKDTLWELASLYLWLEREPNQQGVVPAVPLAYTTPPRGKNRLARSVKNPQTGEWEHMPILPPIMERSSPAEVRRMIRERPDYNVMSARQIVRPDALTDDEKIMIRLETAQAEQAVETIKQSRLERIRAGGAVAVPVAPATTTSTAAAPVVAAPAEPPKVLPKPDDSETVDKAGVPIGALAEGTDADTRNRLQQGIVESVNRLKLDLSAVKSALTKLYGVDTLKALKINQLQDFDERLRKEEEKQKVAPK